MMKNIDYNEYCVKLRRDHFHQRDAARLDIIGTPHCFHSIENVDPFFFIGVDIFTPYQHHLKHLHFKQTG